jgi:hypothetical protein
MTTKMPQENAIAGEWVAPSLYRISKKKYYNTIKPQPGTNISPASPSSTISVPGQSYMYSAKP